MTHSPMEYVTIVIDDTNRQMAKKKHCEHIGLFCPSRNRKGCASLAQGQNKKKHCKHHVNKEQTQKCTYCCIFPSSSSVKLERKERFATALFAILNYTFLLSFVLFLLGCVPDMMARFIIDCTQVQQPDKNLGHSFAKRTFCLTK